ncbi:hypothetical protein OH77DRAFT_1526044 [Trametes cingulata]|nr:hypothetical protein OH77DRAFT_1526044 [Trametes cingulata]
MPVLLPQHQLVGCPRRGDPDRFRLISSFHLWSSGRPALREVSPPYIVAEAAFELPGLLAPWEFGQPLEAYLLRDARLTIGGRTRVGHAVFMFEDSNVPSTALVASPPPGNPPPPSSTLTVLSPTESTASQPDADPDESATSLIVSAIAQAPRAPTPAPFLPRTPQPLPERPRATMETVAEGPSGECEAALDLSAAVNEALEKLEEIVSVWPRTLRTSQIDGWTVMNDVAEDETGYRGDDEGTTTTPTTPDVLTGDVEEFVTPPPPTPEDPSPTVSPLLSPATTPDVATTPSETARVTVDEPAVYNLRPRPVPRKRYLESPPPRVPARKARRKASVIRARPQLALPPVDRVGLDGLLEVPARSWTRSERRFLKAVVRLLQRAVRGGVGHGEAARSDESDASSEEDSVEAWRIELEA